MCFANLVLKNHLCLTVCLQCFDEMPLFSIQATAQRPPSLTKCPLQISPHRVRWARHRDGWKNANSSSVYTYYIYIELIIYNIYVYIYIYKYIFIDILFLIVSWSMVLCPSLQVLGHFSWYIKIVIDQCGGTVEKEGSSAGVEPSWARFGWSWVKPAELISPRPSAVWISCFAGTFNLCIQSRCSCLLNI